MDFFYLPFFSGNFVMLQCIFRLFVSFKNGRAKWFSTPDTTLTDGNAVPSLPRHGV